MSARSSGDGLGVILNSRYRLDGVLGSGGTAVVHRACDLRLDRTVAVKLLHPVYARDEAFLHRFLREAQIAARVSDAPNIVTIFDVGRDADTPYIVMEYVDGPSLREYLATRGPLSVREALAITGQIAEGLAAAHSHGVVHRDIKPHNILISRAKIAKIADFGIAAAASATRLTTPGTIVGSAHYMSPEQVRGEPASAASDVYSLGILLFEMLVGSLPFDGANSAVVAAQQVMAPVPSLRVLRPDIPLPVASFVQQMLAKDPANRISTARAVIDELPGLLALPAAGPPDEAAGTTMVAPITATGKRAWSRPRVAAAGALLAVLAGLLGAVSLGVGGQHGPRRTARSAPRSTVRPAARAGSPTSQPVRQPTAPASLVPTPIPTHVPQPIQAPPSQPPPPAAPARHPSYGKGPGHGGDQGRDRGNGDGRGKGHG